MVPSEGAPTEQADALDVLDQAAGHTIEARALLMMLAPERRDELQVLVDMLLLAMARQIAAELPAGSVGSRTQSAGE